MSGTSLTVPPRVTPGIDVSHHQGNVNWHAVAEAGVSFAFVKATDGDTFVDPQFSTNWTGIKDAGIMRGAYHFFRPARPVDSQVENFVRTIRETGDGDLPSVLDLEEAPTPHGDEWEDVLTEQRVPLVEVARGRRGQVGSEANYLHAAGIRHIGVAQPSSPCPALAMDRALYEQVYARRSEYLVDMDLLAIFGWG